MKLHSSTGLNKKLNLSGLLLIVLGSLNACLDKTDSSLDINTDKYQAKITLTDFGIPHIAADNYAGLGYGEGYMAAKDHVCNIAYGVMVAQGKRSAHLGAGPGNSFVMQDLVTLALTLPTRANEAFESLRTESKDLIEGYAAGYNRYLQENASAAGHWCEGESWVLPASGEEVFARGYYISQTLPRMSAALYSAQPPQEGIAKHQLRDKKAVSDSLLAAAESASQLKELGSNAWAIGRDWTSTGKGMLIANPHYPWFGTDRFWEKHLTIEGEIDIYGVGLTGIPGVAIGFNEAVGWSHTVSSSQRLALFRLTLAEGNPKQYMYDGEVRDLTSKTVSVDVKDENGQISKVEHTLWFSHQGPLLQFPGLGWDINAAYAVSDANYDNFYIIEQWMDMSRASSMQAFVEAHKTWNAMPWVNTIASSKDGEAVYLDNSSVAHLTDEAISQWKALYSANPLIKQLYDDRNLVLLDGSSSLFALSTQGSSPVPGTVPFEQRPMQQRSDYVFNANDSYWLSNYQAPMEEHSPFYGKFETARSLRTRQNILHLVSEEEKGQDGLFSRQELQDAILSNEALAHSIFADALINACTNMNSVSIDGIEKDLSDSCNTISQYNGILDLSSKGAILFREWLQAYSTLMDGKKTSLYSVDFDTENAVNTPSGLKDTDAALNALAMAQDLMNEAGLKLDATLGEVQLAYRGEQIVPMHGGFWFEGVANLIDNRSSNTHVPRTTGDTFTSWSHLTDAGYVVSGGTSFIMALAYTDQGPEAQAFLTYGQSGEADSPHFSDQTLRFSEKAWREIYFTPQAVSENKQSELTLSGN